WRAVQRPGAAAPGRHRDRGHPGVPTLAAPVDGADPAAEVSPGGPRPRPPPRVIRRVRPEVAMRIALFITCVNDLMYPATGRAVVRLLERLGHTVEFPPGQTCCGQMHANSGYAEQARELARRFVATFDPYPAVVAPSGSCVAMVRDAYPRLQPAAASVAARTYELSELLVDVLQVTDVGASFPHRVTYHPTCHGLRTLRLGDRPLRLLRQVRGLQLVDLPE